MLGKTNAGSGGGSVTKSTLIITLEEGSTVYAEKDGKTKYASTRTIDGQKVYILTGLDNGTWTVTATKGDQTATRSVTFTRAVIEYITMTYFSATIVITSGTGATVKATKGDVVIDPTSTSGKNHTFTIPSSGSWKFTATWTDGGNVTYTGEKTVSITSQGAQEENSVYPRLDLKSLLNLPSNSTIIAPINDRKQMYTPKLNFNNWTHLVYVCTASFAQFQYLATTSNTDYANTGTTVVSLYSSNNVPYTGSRDYDSSVALGPIASTITGGLGERYFAVNVNQSGNLTITSLYLERR